MPGQSVEVTGLKELIARMQAFPVKLAQVLVVGMAASLTTFWENVPPYPPEPQDSSYRRTGLLGRTLGSSESGGASGGQPSVFVVRKLGGGNMEGKFGTNLNYAEQVIGEGTQAAVHRGRWWTLKTVAEKATDKIKRIWIGVGDSLVNFLEGKGL
jgi:hypothetical protein